MICPKCGKKIPSRDKYCGYCGALTGSLPIRLLERLPRRSILIPAITIIAIAMLLLVSWATHEVWDVVDASVMEDDPAHHAGITLYSQYAASKAPDIDGVLTQGEWPDPAISIDVIHVVNYDSPMMGQRGEASFYCMNDDEYLYMALTLSSYNPDIFSFDEEGLKLYCEIVFDGDNDGYPSPGDDVKRIGSYYRENSYPLPIFVDEHVDSRGYPDYDRPYGQQEHGEGAEGYAEDTGAWVCECRVPLNSGDPQDLAVEPGDTVGVKWEIQGCRQVRWYEIWDLITRGPDSCVGYVNVDWPSPMSGSTWQGARATTPPCRSLTLAPGLAPAAQENSP